MTLSDADREWLKKYRDETGCSMGDALLKLAEMRFGVKRGDLGERTIPVCYCTARDGAHVHIP